MSQQGPGSPGIPPQPGPPPPPYRSPNVSGSRKLRRSRTDRKLAGVAGGLAEYLGVDANFMRVAFVLVSVFFLAVFIGVVLYALAVVVIPEEGDDSAIGGPFRDVFSGRPWQDWDRTARSWAIVLGALTLAVLWSVAQGPGLHWRALPVLLLAAGLALWAVTRFGHGPGPNPPVNWPPSSRRPPDGSGPYGSGPYGSGPYGSGPYGAAGPPGGPGTSPTGPPAGPPTGAASPYASPSASPDGSPSASPAGSGGSLGYSGAAGSGGSLGNSGPAGAPGYAGAIGSGGGGGFAGAPAPSGTHRLPGSSGAPPVAAPSGSQEAADWVQAQSAAAGWAEQQLAAAGLPPSPPAAGNTQVPPSASRRRPHRRVGPSGAAVTTGLLLLIVIAAVTVTLASGSSLRGGIGDTTLAPATESSVASHYRLGVGHLDVDLSAVKFPPGDRTISVSLGIGQLSVEVPSGTVVMVSAHSGVGDVDVFGVQGSDVNVESRLRGPLQLTIDAHVGIGAIRVTQPARR